MKRKQFLMSVAVAALCAATLCIPTKAAQAQQAEVGSIAYLPPAAVTDIEPAAGGDDNKMIGEETNRRTWARYFEYEHREHCQNYVEPPSGWIKVGCALERVGGKQAAIEQTVTTIEPAAGGEAAVLPNHTQLIYFDFDHSEIRPDQQAAVTQTAADIRAMRPSLVTVSGYADAAGPNDYNDRLSARRAQSVTNALTAQGVSPSIIKQEYYGETNLAVPTPDGQPLQANRRVSVDFVPMAQPVGTPGM